MAGFRGGPLEPDPIWSSIVDIFGSRYGRGGTPLPMVPVPPLGVMDAGLSAPGYAPSVGMSFNPQVAPYTPPPQPPPADGFDYNEWVRKSGSRPGQQDPPRPPINVPLTPTPTNVDLTEDTETKPLAPGAAENDTDKLMRMMGLMGNYSGNKWQAIGNALTAGGLALLGDKPQSKGGKIARAIGVGTAAYNAYDKAEREAAADAREKQIKTLLDWSKAQEAERYHRDIIDTRMELGRDRIDARRDQLRLMEEMNKARIEQHAADLEHKRNILDFQIQAAKDRIEQGAFKGKSPFEQQVAIEQAIRDGLRLQFGEGNVTPEEYAREEARVNKIFAPWRTGTGATNTIPGTSTPYSRKVTNSKGTFYQGADGQWYGPST